MKLKKSLPRATLESLHISAYIANVKWFFFYRYFAVLFLSRSVWLLIGIGGTTSFINDCQNPLVIISHTNRSTVRFESNRIKTKSSGKYKKKYSKNEKFQIKFMDFGIIPVLPKFKYHFGWVHSFKSVFMISYRWVMNVELCDWSTWFLWNVRRIQTFTDFVLKKLRTRVMLSYSTI